MAKSTRSKWKKQHKRIKAENAKSDVERRVGGLNEKLGLAARSALGRHVPMQEPTKEFHFTPGAVTYTAGQKLQLKPFSTNVHKGLRGHEGNADGTTGVQSQQRTLVTMKPADAPRAGTSAAQIAEARATEEKLRQLGDQTPVWPNMPVESDEEEGSEIDDADAAAAGLKKAAQQAAGHGADGESEDDVASGGDSPVELDIDFAANGGPKTSIVGKKGKKIAVPMIPDGSDDEDGAAKAPAHSSGPAVVRLPTGDATKMSGARKQKGADSGRRLISQGKGVSAAAANLAKPIAGKKKGYDTKKK
jgi:hypothetical protein